VTFQAKNNFNRLVQQRVADGSIGPSTVRSMGPEGTAQAVREFLREPQLLLAFASATSKTSFLKILDAKTELLKSKLPGGDRIRKRNQNKVKIGVWGARWGVARKCLNIFLYESISSRWLCEAYPGLMRLEPWLEVPLDSYVGYALHKRGANSAWKNVIDLTQQQSDEYQEFACVLAAGKKIDRVHLDLEFFNERKDD
jgi:hypothetical protein